MMENEDGDDSEYFVQANAKSWPKLTFWLLIQSEQLLSIPDTSMTLGIFWPSPAHAARYR